MKIRKRNIALMTLCAALAQKIHAQDINREPATSKAESVEEIVVVGTRQSRYVVGSSDATSRIDLDFLENPRSVTTLPEQLMLDRKITNLEEALRNAPGTVAGDGFGGTRDDFFVRGFRRNAEYRDGFRRETIFKTNLANIENVEVIRGPSAITFGQVAPGGLVNVNTKRPLDTRRLSGEIRAGSFDEHFGLIDWSQPLADSAAIRVVGSVQNAESFRDFTDIDRDSLAISGRWHMTDRTRIEAAYEYRKESRPLDRGTLAVTTPDGFITANQALNIPFSRRFGEPFEDFDVEFNYLEARLFHNISERWSISTAVAFEDAVANDLQARVQRIFVADANDTRISDDGFVADGVDPAALVNELRSATFDDPTDRVFLQKRLDGSQNRDGQTLHANFIVNGRFKTGSLRNRIAIGVDFRDSDNSRQFVIGDNTDGVDVPFFNLQSGAYVLSGAFTTEGVPVATFDNLDYGLFVNNYTDITANLGLLLGLSYRETEGDFIFPVFRFESKTEASAWTPQAGLTYKITGNVSVYGSYAESFTPNNAVPLGASEFKAVDPQEGEQFELGVKAKLFDGRAQAQAAIYQIDLINVFTGTDADLNPIFVDGQTSEGLELTVTGQPVRGMNVTASYAYTDARLSNGKRASIVPENTFNIYASYEVQGGNLEGFGVGAGVFYESNRFGNAANNFELGSYTLFDASVWYTIPAPSVLSDAGTIRFQLAGKNLLDEEYFVGTSSQNRIPLGTPRTVFASVSFDF